MPGAYLLQGDARQIPLADGSVQCVVTSPPYWGLRSYGTDPRVWGGAPDHAHEWGETVVPPRHSDNGVDGSTLQGGKTTQTVTQRTPTTYAFCPCGAWRGELGLEPTPELYVAHLVEVFREVRRVLRADGTCWLNLGDSYAGSWGNQGRKPERGTQRPINGAMLQPLAGQYPERESNTGACPPGLKPKDLVGIPWRVAFALQADGWVLRSDVVWSKPNPMPESITDRPTKAHEMLFLLSKGKWSGALPGRYSERISREDARWLALLIDTEGTITVKRVLRGERLGDQFGAQVSVGNTSRVLLEHVRAIVGEGNILEWPGKNAPMFYWQLACKKARDLLLVIYPHLIVKQRQARVALHLEAQFRHRGKRGAAKERTPRETALLVKLWETNKDLNHFGTPDLEWVPAPRFGGWTSQPYYYDAEAIKEPGQDWGQRDRSNSKHNAESFRETGQSPHSGFTNGNAQAGRNRRSVWTIATEPYPEAHFATFPEKLVEPCILAGTSARGACPTCGAPWGREVARKPSSEQRKNWAGHGASKNGASRIGGFYDTESTTLGWSPSCACPPADPVPCRVFDPFSGSGTTVAVAERLGRVGIGLELKPSYLDLARRRTMQAGLL